MPNFAGPVASKYYASSVPSLIPSLSARSPRKHNKSVALLVSSPDRQVRPRAHQRSPTIKKTIRPPLAHAFPHSPCPLPPSAPPHLQPYAPLCPTSPCGPDQAIQRGRPSPSVSAHIRWLLGSANLVSTHIKSPRESGSKFCPAHPRPTQHSLAATRGPTSLISCLRQYTRSPTP